MSSESEPATRTRDTDAAVTSLWSLLDTKHTSPMQGYAWNHSCWTTLPAVGALRLLSVDAGAGSAAIAPLVETQAGLHRLVQLGVDHLHEPSDFSYSDETALDRLAARLVRTRLPLLLKRVPADSPTVGALRDAYRGHGLLFVRPASPFPRIVLGEAWRTPERQLNAGRRSDLRRARHAAEALGPLRYEVLAPTPAELGPLLDLAFDIEAASWKGRDGSAVRQDPMRAAFFRSYAEAASQAGRLRLAFLHAGVHSLAMELAVESGGSLWLLKIGYREEFSRCSPGMLLMAHTIRYAAEQGLRSYEFLGTAEAWTRIWTKDERASLTIRAYPFGMRGLAALVADATGLAKRRFERALTHLTQ